MKKILILLLFAFSLIATTQKVEAQSFNGYIINESLPPGDTVEYVTTNSRFSELFSWATQFSAIADGTGTTPNVELQMFKTLNGTNFVAYGNADQTVTTASQIYQADTAFFDRRMKFRIINKGSDTSTVKLYYSVKDLFR